MKKGQGSFMGFIIAILLVFIIGIIAFFIFSGSDKSNNYS